MPCSRERGWKLKQCKRHATAVSKSNLSIEARVAAREKQEAEAIRKKASFVAKQVCVWVDLLKERNGLPQHGSWTLFQCFTLSHTYTLRLRT